MILFKVRFMILIALLFVACGGDQPVPENDATDTNNTTETTNKTLAENSDSLTIELTGIDSVSVLDLLLKAHQVDYRSTLSGAFVTAIDAHENGDDYFWIYTVNDTKVSVACDEYITFDGDRVIWHFRKF